MNDFSMSQNKKNPNPKKSIIKESQQQQQQQQQQLSQQNQKTSESCRNKSERKLYSIVEHQESSSFLDQDHYYQRSESEPQQYKSNYSIDDYRDEFTPKKKVLTYQNQNYTLNSIQLENLSLNTHSVDNEMQGEAQFQSSYYEDDYHIYQSEIQKLNQ
ncbi:unnamed protein product [Paramecium primaurelia]|uniref:Uncharacterized protein n=1 Tax=Paramecium primaurelia TaxID=5886 RepID=A0A8S1JVA2_PARPR|nr:unnamed protein product [Paramecium primaurelia]